MNSRVELDGLVLQLIHRSPNIYIIDNFLEEQEVLVLQARAEARASGKCFCRRFHGSTTGSAILTTTDYARRTSTFFYLRPYGDALARRISDRAGRLMGHALNKIEPLQVVRYQPGQQFKEHHDSASYNPGAEMFFDFP